ncbi:hypothetical protein [Paenibacillus sp. BC26]|uniref:hypothetical protein n=1 Tax=Paenibacillus sp. BC26 TaxID=1881032 RepID=UPI0008EA784C|nr:hypothetical protein [Paenibacillus sp. BC26]SFS70204.1 hypothetical protein SAMN05428962_2371 [Paenibacillus sp. BC26]
MQNALLTSIFTVTGGLIIFFFSQIILKYLIEPISDYRKLRYQISIQLVFYANRISNPVEFNDVNSKNEKLVKDVNEASNAFRKLASELIGVINIIPMYPLFSLIRLVPNTKDIIDASSNLIGLSNSIWKYGDDNEEPQRKYNEENRKEIKRLLKIKSY